MNKCKRLLVMLCCTIILVSNIFMCYTMHVYAKPTLDENGHLHVYNWDDIKECATDWVMHMATQIGAVFIDHSFSSYVQNKEAWNDYWKEDNVIISESGTSVTFSLDLMAFIKQCIEEYAREHEPYCIVQISSYKDLDPENYENKGQYNTICNLAKEHGLISVNGRYIANLSDVLVDGYGIVSNMGVDYDWSIKTGTVLLYDADWNNKIFPVKMYPNGNEPIVYNTYDQMDELPSSMYITTHNKFYPNDVLLNGKTQTYNSSVTYFVVASLISKNGGRYRVYNSLDDYKRYSVGKRSVYYTSNYYNYVPEDLTVTLDDLEKAVDDLQKIIDDLLDKINDNTSESEIEDLLRQILEALREQQSSGGGGSGSGDVTVDIDLSTTNNWLSKIYSKVSQIFDKMDSVIEDAEQTAIDKIQDSLDEIIKQLKAIKGWTIADTIIDGADAVADWLDFIKDFLIDAGSGVATISSTMDSAASLLKTKFPFCIPWDVYALISFLAHEPETPVFSLPIKLERLGIEEYIEVDLSQFKVVSDISRTLLTLIYCYALLNLTMKIFPMTKEEA